MCTVKPRFRSAAQLSRQPLILRVPTTAKMEERRAYVGVVTYTAQLQILKCVVNGMCYRVIAWALKFMITKKT
jgi:hypothetical protein